VVDTGLDLALMAINSTLRVRIGSLVDGGEPWSDMVGGSSDASGKDLDIADLDSGSS